ncbi:methionine synthase-like protein [Lentinula aciculospora]|uniref:Methionine synthase-like protein n=1 Tax=Lentinula aciculospora TaxID=153920 RepID=A0A9W9DK15_9AGAR|nr:methionine synthase-like protein [Lentinula aciculospora]
MSPPFRAEHLGSLLRPADLLAKRTAITEHKANPEELPPVENAAIEFIVKKQTELGFRSITDGEYGRHMFWGTFFPNLNGMTEIYHPPIGIFRAYAPDVAAFIESVQIPGESVVCTGKISHTGESTYVGQVKHLQSLVPEDRWGEIKLTVAAPSWYHLRYMEGQAYPKDVYVNDKEYFADIAKAYQVELDILYKAGLRNVQFDDPNLVCESIMHFLPPDFCSEKMLKGWEEDKTNITSADDMFDAYIQLYNDCLSKAPADMHFGVHLCRGNFVGSRHFSEGSYDRIATKLFQSLNVHTYYLEYDTPRAGGFEPLAYLPKNKYVILGVVTSKFPKLEDKEEMKHRVYEAAEIIAKGNGETKEDALGRMGVSPQCGFASHEAGNSIDMQGMEDKLRLIREIADEIWSGEA